MDASLADCVFFSSLISTRFVVSVVLQTRKRQISTGIVKLKVQHLRGNSVFRFHSNNFILATSTRRPFLFQKSFLATFLGSLHFAVWCPSFTTAS